MLKKMQNYALRFIAIYIVALKKQFSVNSYKNIAVKEFEKARLMITTWIPDEIMMLAIQGAKSQMSLM